MTERLVLTGWRLIVVAVALCATAGCGARRSATLQTVPREFQPVSAPDEPQNRRIVRNAALHIVTGTEHEFPDIIEGARKLATGAGGYVVEESSTSIALRIPNERLDSVLASLTTLGKVTRKNVTARDVTAEYTDLEIRLDNARALEGRLKEILKQASTVAETLDVERELARVTLELDKLEGQKRLMNSQITFATLRLTLSGRIRKGPLGWAFYGLYRGVKWLFVWS